MKLPILSTKKGYGITAAILLILVVLVIALLNVKHGSRDLPQIMENGRLYVLADSSSIGFSKHKGTVSGFQYEIIKAFADTLGLELVISEQNNYHESVDALLKGDFDLIANLSPTTTEYAEKVLYSKPFYSAKLVLVQLTPTDSAQLYWFNKKTIDLANDTICIPKGSPHKLRLLNLSDEIAHTINITELKEKSTEQLVQLVATGKIKQTICDERYALKLKQKYPNIDITVAVGFDQPLAWAVNVKSPLLHEKLNQFLNDFVSTPTYWRIYTNYLK